MSGDPQRSDPMRSDPQRSDPMRSDPMPSDPMPDVTEMLLELRDEIIGVQAQLDELRARLDELERSNGAPRGAVARVRARIKRATGARAPAS